MERSKRYLAVVVSASVVVLAGLYLGNASWLAIPSRGTPRVIAQRGVAQRYLTAEVTDDSCTARLIQPPIHSFIDNTIPSIEAAVAAGADVVEIDLRITGDRQFVLFHDSELTCRTNGSGRVSERSVSELQTLDVGYGYTADQGKSFPLRGRGIGLMPTFVDVLRKFPRQRFLVQIKDGERRVGDRLAAYLRSNQQEAWDRLIFFGGAAPLYRLRQIAPTVRTWSARSTQECFVGYLEAGWFGHVPRVTDRHIGAEW